MRVLVAQPRVHVGNVDTNVVEHAKAIVAAGARVAVFPELSLTGYDLGAESVSPHQR